MTFEDKCTWFLSFSYDLVVFKSGQHHWLAQKFSFGREVQQLDDDDICCHLAEVTSCPCVGFVQVWGKSVWNAIISSLQLCHGTCPEEKWHKAFWAALRACSTQGMEANEVLKVRIKITAITRRRMNIKTSRRTTRAVMHHFGVFPPSSWKSFLIVELCPYYLLQLWISWNQ